MAADQPLTMQRLPEEFWLYQMTARELPSDLLQLDRTVFFQVTPDEVSVMTSGRPGLAGQEQGPWKGWAVAGPLDFSLVGILARISGLLADAEIPVFVISTFNTDYVFVAAAQVQEAEQALVAGGIQIQEALP